MNLIAILALIYGGVAGGAYVFQRRLQYHPDKRLTEPQETGLAGFHRVKVRTADGLDLVAWQAHAMADRPVIVYLQGNAEGLSSRHERFQAFHADGYGVLALGYRGFSGSPGKPSEEGLARDAEAAVSYLEASGCRSRASSFTANRWVPGLPCGWRQRAGRQRSSSNRLTPRWSTLRGGAGGFCR